MDGKIIERDKPGRNNIHSKYQLGKGDNGYLYWYGDTYNYKNIDDEINDMHWRPGCIENLRLWDTKYRIVQE